MSTPKDYRGTTTYVHVLAELVRAAQYRGTTTYQDVAVIMGITVTGNYMSQQTGKILGEISTEEVNAGRPMLSAVAVSVNGAPSKGFFSLARYLGLLKEDQDEYKFWEKERDKVYDAWKRPLPVKAAGKN